MEELSSEAAARAASLIGVGAQAGAIVVGLSGVRRTKGLALLFVDASVSDNTQAELARLTRRGTRVFRCASLAILTGVVGRQDASVLGVKAGSLARGILGKLQPND